MNAGAPIETSLFELYRRESDEHVEHLSQGLLVLERDPRNASRLEDCMRAAHSLKGAARIVGIEAGVALAHAMETCFVAAQRGERDLDKRQIDRLLHASDLLRGVAEREEQELLLLATGPESDIGRCIAGLQLQEADAATHSEPARVGPTQSDATAAPHGESNERILRVTAETLNRLLGLAGESLVDSRRLRPFAQSLLGLKRLQAEVATKLERLREGLSQQTSGQTVLAELKGIEARVLECQRLLTSRLSEFESLEHRSVRLSQTLFEEALKCRMRPFGDGVRAFPRMIRDLARSLNKEVRLNIRGEATQVDRDILERLDAPLGHLLRNAVDHGIETAPERRLTGKSAEGTVELTATQRAGRLLVSVRDDGAGIDLERVRECVVRRGIATAATVERLSKPELLDFLLLPGFTLRETVTDVSGRGVGLDAVHHMLKEVRGTLRITSEHGHGTEFQLQLPLTLSVIRGLLVEVAGEAYAVPLASIVRTSKLSGEQLSELEGRPHFDLNGRRIGLVTAHQALDRKRTANDCGELSVVVIGDEERPFGVLVDRLLGERELVVHPLDARLGKVKNVSAASLMEDGSPVLILDVEDLIRSMERMVTSDVLRSLTDQSTPACAERRKRVLVVEDSLTVRELERKLLANAGYEVEIAVDGMDGWNALRAGEFDLVVTDIDMPRMDGIELVKEIRQHPNLRSVPVMIVSYKDRPEDRNRGLEAGADFYLAKASFHDESLVEAAAELIGRPAA